MKKHTLYALLLLCFMTVYIRAQPYNPFFIPRQNHPFTLFSPGGTLLFEDAGESSPAALLIETDGRGQNVQIAAQDLPEFSLQSRTLFFWIKVEGRDQLQDLWIYASSDTDFSDRVVYKISRDKTQLVEGEWVRVSLPPSEGEPWGNPDLSRLKAMQVWCNDKGEDSVKIHLGPVYIAESTESSRVLLTFDDGWASQLDKAAPIMEEYGMSGTAYIIPEKVGTEGYLTLEEIKHLRDSYGWSIGAHALPPLDQMDEAALHPFFQDQQEWFSEAGLAPADFAYPMGRFSSTLLKVLPQYYRSGRSVIEWAESSPPGDAYRLRVTNIVRDFPLDRLESRLNAINDKGEILILVLHKIEEEPGSETEISPEQLEEICRLIQESGLAVKNTEDLAASLGLPILPAGVDMGQATILQTAASLVPEQRNTESPGDKSGPETWEPMLGTQIQFSLDWRMAFGTRDSDEPDPPEGVNSGSTGDPQFYSQLDDLYFYIQKDLSPSAYLYASAGWESVNLEGLGTDAFQGSDMELHHLYLEQQFRGGWSFLSGYYSPDPVKKWLQVSRSAGIESALGQDMTPDSLWLHGYWQSPWGIGLQTAIMPDLIGKEGSGSYNVLTYQQTLGVPNGFFSLWYSGGSSEGEFAFAINGDAVKAAMEEGWYHSWDALSLSASMGVKYTRGSEFKTFPEWDHLDDAWRISTAWSCVYPIGEIKLNPGVAYQLLIRPEVSTRHLLGVDIGLLYKNWELFGVLTQYNLEDWEWGINAGGEAGVILHTGGVEYMAGVTMAGFHNQSGLYNNREDLEGGVNGAFIRIKATYW